MLKFGVSDICDWVPYMYNFFLGTSQILITFFTEFLYFENDEYVHFTETSV